jgi:hypothetical protein
MMMIQLEFFGQLKVNGIVIINNGLIDEDPRGIDEY